MALNKKDLNFFHFLAHLPQKVGDPCYTVYCVLAHTYSVLYILQESLPSGQAFLQ